MSRVFIYLTMSSEDDHYIPISTRKTFPTFQLSEYKSMIYDMKTA